jgi:integrase
LNAAFETAIDNDICDKNPVRRAEIASKAQDEKEAFSEDEVTTILDFAKTDELFGVVMFLLLSTGIRGGEARALSADRINLTEGYLTIDRAIKRTGVLGKPKNGRTRYIPLEPEVVEFLKTKLHDKSGYIMGGDFYVTHSGLRGRYEWFFDRLNRHLAENGEPTIEIKSPHCCRHTFSTLCQKRGMPIAMVAELMGHSTIEMTKKYTHFGDISTLSEAVRKYPFFNRIA